MPVVIHQPTPRPPERVVVIEAPPPPPPVVIVEAPAPPPETVIIEAPSPLPPPPAADPPTFEEADVEEDYPPPPDFEPLTEAPPAVVAAPAPPPPRPSPPAVEATVAVRPTPSVRPTLGVGLALVSAAGEQTTFTGLRAYGGLEWSRISLLGGLLLGPAELGDRLRAVDVEARYHLGEGGLRPWLAAGLGLYPDPPTPSSQGMSAGAKLGLGADIGADDLGLSLALGARPSAEAVALDATAALTWRF